MECHHHPAKGQRYTISVLSQAKKSKKEICRITGVSRSTLHRELRRNSLDGAYNGEDAENVNRESVLSNLLEING